MSRRRTLATSAERAAKYAARAWARIQADEITSERKMNVELELAMAWLAGNQETIVRPAPRET